MVRLLVSPLPKPVANFIKLFWCNLHSHQHTALSFDYGYASRSINYSEKVLLNWPLETYLRQKCEAGPEKYFLRQTL
jgi:hypothetical protein